MAKSTRAISRKSGLTRALPQPRPQIEVQQDQEAHHQHQLDPVGAGDVHRAESPAAGCRRGAATGGGGAGRGVARAAAASGGRLCAAARRRRGRGGLRSPAVAMESACRTFAIESSRIASSAESLGKAPLHAGARRSDQHHDVGDGPRIGRGQQAVHPLPAGLLPHAHRSRVPTGIPLGYTPPRPEESTRVPAGTESR